MAILADDSQPVISRIRSRVGVPILIRLRFHGTAPGYHFMQRLKMDAVGRMLYHEMIDIPLVGGLPADDNYITFSLGISIESGCRALCSSVGDNCWIGRLCVGLCGDK